jgi:predicted SAM-dependent methyltransferase
MSAGRLWGGVRRRLRSAVARVRPERSLRPTAPMPGLKVHIGCGFINIEGWVNIDARAMPHVHIHTESIELDEFADGAVAEIYLCHVLEHFSFAEVEHLLRVFHRKLAPGGTLRLSVPDFDLLLQVYRDTGDLDVISMALMGGQDYAFNFHKNVFNATRLQQLLLAAGFSSVNRWDAIEDFGLDLGDWSTRSFEIGGRSFKVSLNLKASK